MKIYARAEADFIQNRAAERIEDVLEALGIQGDPQRNYIHAACPVHGGDNPRAWYWAYGTMHWCCNTQHCEENEITGPSSSVFGLVRGVMAHKTGQRWGFNAAVDFVAKVLGLTATGLNGQTQADILADNEIKKWQRSQNSKPARLGTPLALLAARMKPDTVYYPQRGLSENLIGRYHISYCDEPGKPFYQRAYFPILDASGRYIQGFSARSIFEKCPECRCHHDPSSACPANPRDVRYVKWRHSAGFRAERCLYNIWHAKPCVFKCGVAILCEGPGDVWAFEAAGIPVAVAMFGLHLSADQLALLQQAQALTVILATDNDKSGLEARERLLRELNRSFRAVCVTPEAKDIGAMRPAQIAQQYGPALEKYSMQAVLRGSEGGQDESVHHEGLREAAGIWHRHEA